MEKAVKKRTPSLQSYIIEFMEKEEEKKGYTPAWRKTNFTLDLRRWGTRGYLESEERGYQEFFLGSEERGYQEFYLWSEERGYQEFYLGSEESEYQELSAAMGLSCQTDIACGRNRNNAELFLKWIIFWCKHSLPNTGQLHFYNFFFSHALIHFFKWTFGKFSIIFVLFLKAVFPFIYLFFLFSIFRQTK